MEPNETFKFDDKAFAQRMKELNPDALWDLERDTLQSKVFGGTGIAISYSYFILGGIFSLAYASRAVDIARRKVRAARRELRR